MVCLMTHKTGPHEERKVQGKGTFSGPKKNLSKEKENENENATNRIEVPYNFRVVGTPLWATPTKGEEAVEQSLRSGRPHKESFL
jgi:hypothetical protein